MKSTSSGSIRKRPVNLSINEDLVSSARGLTDNLSGLVEQLLADYVAQNRAKEEARAKACRATSSLWNAFGEQHGSFADEHSTL